MNKLLCALGFGLAFPLACGGSSSDFHSDDGDAGESATGGSSSGAGGNGGTGATGGDAGSSLGGSSGAATGGIAGTAAVGGTETGGTSTGGSSTGGSSTGGQAGEGATGGTDPLGGTGGIGGSETGGSGGQTGDLLLRIRLDRHHQRGGGGGKWRLHGTHINQIGRRGVSRPSGGAMTRAMMDAAVEVERQSGLHDGAWRLAISPSGVKKGAPFIDPDVPLNYHKP